MTGWRRIKWELRDVNRVNMRSGIGRRMNTSIRDAVRGLDCPVLELTYQDMEELP